MSVLLYVAADIYAQKVNLQLESAKLPSLAELFQTVQQTFTNECQVLRPPGSQVQTFGIEKIQIYADEPSKDPGRQAAWKDLVSSSQLGHRAQLYVFQTDPNVVESQQKISRHLSRKPSPQPITASARPTMRQTYHPPSVPISPVSRNSHSFEAAMQPQHRGGLGTPSNGNSNPYEPLLSEVPAELSPIRFRSAAALAAMATPKGIRSASTATIPISASRTGTPMSSTPPAYSPGVLPVPNSGSKFAQKDTSSKHPGEHAPASEKQRYLFQMITSRTGTREVELDSLRCFLENHHFDMASTIALGDLFARSDKDKNGKLNAAELSNLFQLLPTLMDSLYFRLLDAEDFAQLSAQYQRDHSTLESLQAKQLSVASQADQIAQEINVQAGQLSRNSDHAETLSLTIEDEKDAIRSLEQESERLKREKDECTEDARRQSSIVEQSKLGLQDVRRKAEHAEAFARQSQMKLSAFEERVAELQRMLAHAQEEVSSQRQAVETSSREATFLRNQESDLTNRERELLQGLSVRRERASELDLLLQKRRQAFIAHTETIQRLDREAQEIRAQRQVEEQKLQRLRQSESEVLQQVSRIAEQAAAQEEKLRGLDEKVQQFNQRRVAMEQRERPLLEQELMLRSHRDALDQQEERLRREVGTLFYGNEPQ